MNPKARSVIVPFRVTPAEKEQIESRAFDAQMCTGDYIRHCVFKKEIVVVEGADELAQELRRIGNNLNQLTRAVNAGIVSQINLTETGKELARIWQSLNSLHREAR